ncbi:MAG: AraC family transcriptional regulator [Lachnospiraceae bacterium]|nr:AraC family transcriptional regulator [Lachnospiraceae bacterium]
MENNIMYYRKDDGFEYIFYQNSTQSYPMHTHARHIVLGYILEGAVRIICNEESCLYHAGEYYYILPDTPHAVEQINGITYSMICICIFADKTEDESENADTCLKELKQIILEMPENTLRIKDMAKNVGLSPYHMIRQFKSVCGLTPHQFQIQCRVRNAQKLLEKGISITEAAYATGFCDQSHFDRCFRKIVRLTPSEYKKVIGAQNDNE